MWFPKAFWRTRHVNCKDEADLTIAVDETRWSQLSMGEVRHQQMVCHTFDECQQMPLTFNISKTTLGKNGGSLPARELAASAGPVTTKTPGAGSFTAWTPATLCSVRCGSCAGRRALCATAMVGVAGGVSSPLCPASWSWLPGDAVLSVPFTTELIASQVTAEESRVEVVASPWIWVAYRHVPIWQLAILVRMLDTRLKLCSKNSAFMKCLRQAQASQGRLTKPWFS